ncbi:MAG: hypothetical protein AAF387_05430 [Pseudomonadota bacterium]
MLTLRNLIVVVTLLVIAPSMSAQMAPIQLTNPAVDSVPGNDNAAWIADENMGVLYCELIEESTRKRVVCYDSNGAVLPQREGR